MKSPGASCPGALQKRAEATGGSLAVSIDLRVSTPMKTAPFPGRGEAFSPACKADDRVLGGRRIFREIETNLPKSGRCSARFSFFGSPFENDR